ncbi:MAG: hypothetical protein JXA30_20260 [Deltaproteobacteria bacterium]|nr:hypothetical protein [Deltaproteobacteria bacterium]
MAQGTDTIYFVMSRMYVAETAGLWDCQSHAWPCNQVYNTFIMSMDVVW